MGLGCVKTPTCNLRVEIPSRFRQLENQKYLRPLLGEDDRENNSAHSRLVHVFTQTGSKKEVSGIARHVRFALRSRHCQPAPACPFGAKGGSRRPHSIARPDDPGELITYYA